MVRPLTVPPYRLCFGGQPNRLAAGRQNRSSAGSLSGRKVLPCPGLLMEGPAGTPAGQECEQQAEAYSTFDQNEHKCSSPPVRQGSQSANRETDHEAC